MKRIMMVLPLAVLLAYCSGPNNTQTTTGTDMNGTSNSVSASTTGTATSDATASSTDVSDVNTNTATVSASGSTSASDISSSTSTSTTNNSVSTTGVIPMDTTDPMYLHWQRTNGQNWTWDLNYPGYDRPVAGTYNSAINGNWQLVMTPELVTAWRQDNSTSLWNGYAADGRYVGNSTYLSASESFNTRSTSSRAVAQGSRANAQGSLHSLNNNASVNSSVANQMNGNTSGTATLNGSTGVAGSATLGTGAGVSGSAGISAGSTSSNGTLRGSTDLNGSLNSMDVNSINYNAANGNMYQLPKFNLYLDNGSFTGYTGCNSISGRVQLAGSSLHFLNTAPSTNIDCLGGLDQNVFIDMLRRVDSYAYVGDELQLMQGSQVLLRFRKGGTGLQ